MKAKGRKDEGRLGGDQLERVAHLFKAFAEPTRLAILQELKGGSRTVGEVVTAIGTSQANVSKQLRILREAGVVKHEKQGTSVSCSIADPVVFELCELVCDKINRDLARDTALLRF